MTLRNWNTPKKGSAWHAWQIAGYEWRQNTWSHSDNALLVAANAFASFSDSENERNAKKRAFIEGANLTTDPH